MLLPVNGQRLRNPKKITVKQQLCYARLYTTTIPRNELCDHPGSVAKMLNCVYNLPLTVFDSMFARFSSLKTHLSLGTRRVLSI